MVFAQAAAVLPLEPGWGACKRDLAAGVDRCRAAYWDQLGACHSAGSLAEFDSQVRHTCPLFKQDSMLLCRHRRGVMMCVMFQGLLVPLSGSHAIALRLRGLIGFYSSMVVLTLCSLLTGCCAGEHAALCSRTDCRSGGRHACSGGCRSMRNAAACTVRPSAVLCHGRHGTRYRCCIAVPGMLTARPLCRPFTSALDVSVLL